MATSLEFIKFVSDQTAGAGDLSYRKMFGEYMLYCDAHPVFLVCDDTVYVKQLPQTAAVFAKFGITPDTGTPYDGAKPHYILDIENAELSVGMARTLAQILPIPKKRTK